jgi:hypothetical protein
MPIHDPDEGIPGDFQKEAFISPLVLSLSKDERKMLILSRFDRLSANGFFLFRQLQV